MAELEEQQRQGALKDATRGLAEFVVRVLESGLGVGGSQKVHTALHGTQAAKESRALTMIHPQNFRVLHQYHTTCLVHHQ